MSLKVSLRHRIEWDRHGLMRYSELMALPLSRCNTGEDDAGPFGEWYFVPDDPLPNGHRVIYYAYFGSHLPAEGAPHIFAAIYDTNDPDELAEYTFRVHEWQGQPERDPQP